MKYLFFFSYSKSLSLNYSFLLSKINLNVLSFVLTPQFGNILKVKDLYTSSGKSLSKIIENSFFSSLFGGWSNKIFLYNSSYINKYYMKVLLS